MAKTPSPELRVFVTKVFSRFAVDFGATDQDLWDTAHAECDADLGGGVFKYRLARKGEGAKGGARAFIAIRHEHIAVYMFAFEKKDLANITAKELRAFRKAAKVWLTLPDDMLTKAVKAKAIREIRKPVDGERNASEDIQKQSDGRSARKHVRPSSDRRNR